VPVDAIYFAYDGDDDDHAGMKANGYTQVHACAMNVPTDPPAACLALPLPCGLGTTTDACCPPGMWKPAAGIPQDDCDDRSSTVTPAEPENCGTTYDDNCNGVANEQCECVSIPSDPSYSTNCSEESDGTPITWPGGAPQGSYCKYGTKTCQSTGH